MGAEGWAIAIFGGAAAGLIVAGIVAIFSSTVRNKFWKPLGRGFRLITTVRLTTTKRLAEQKRASDKLQAELNDALHARSRKAITAEMLAHQRGRAEALAELEVQRTAYVLRPTWTIDDLPIRWAYDLRNTQKGVSISDVSITVDAELFRFNSENQWPGEFSETVRFEGALTRAGRVAGATVTVRWRDSNGDWQEGPAFIERAPTRARAVVL
jgi:hypothetical protein